MEITFIVLSGLTIGLVQAIKQIGLNQKFAPLVAIAIGIALSVLAAPINSETITLSVFQGLIIGLTSVGLYSGVKNTIKN